MTLKAPPLSAFGRALSSAAATTYARRIAAARVQAERNVLAAIPPARVRWRFRIVANGFAVVVPTADVAKLADVPGIAEVWPNVRYHALLNRSPEVIGADKLWGPTFATAGNGMKIGIIDEGVDATHPFFDPSGFTYPPGFPKGRTRSTTPKVIVQRTFPPPSPSWKYASAPVDPQNSFHGTHVAGIAAGDHGAQDGSLVLSGVAPNAYLGNYKALTIPACCGFGLDGNSAEIAAAIEAAVADGMNVINLSLGEPEVEPSRDLVVRAIDGAAAAGVVPVVAAGNDFGELGFGTVSSPATAPGAITVAAATKSDVIADFSSAGPTPVSLQFKPDVTAPGVAITSSLPAPRLWGQLNGTSMASPHVAGAAALLEERHPGWTVAQIKSALVLTGDPVRETNGTEVPATREGGGMIDLPLADNPLVFAAPSSLAFPVNGGVRSVDLSDAGGGAGPWSVAVALQQQAEGVGVTAPTSITVPGRLDVTASVAASAPAADVTGFVVLTRGTDVRRIPLWLEVSHPVLAQERHLTLTKPGVYSGTTQGGGTGVVNYRYPTNIEPFNGPEIAYRVTIRGAPANFGVARLSGRATPHIVFAGDEDHLAGYTALPNDLNPYRKTFSELRPVSGVILPAPGAYDIVFDEHDPVGAGPFTFRYWINDTTPPKIAIGTAPNRRITVKITDAGSGVDPTSVSLSIDGRTARVPLRSGVASFLVSPGAHRVVVHAADYQEMKNMEDVAKILPNTATASVTVTVRR